MKIREIRAIGLRGGTPEGGWSNELKPTDCVHTLVAVVTDSGLVGWGSASTNDDLVKAALGILEPLYIGASGLEPDRLSNAVDRHTFWMGHGGAITHAISAIDIALWDILGQATGQSVGRLLSGRHRERVRPYASVLMEEPAPLAESLGRLRAAGFTAFKIGWGPFGRESDAVDESIVRAARDAVGPDNLLMVDAGGSDGQWSHGLSWAIRTSEMLAEHGVAWFEEPLRPDAIDDYIRLRTASRVAIAGCEVLTRRSTFLPWLERGAVDIVQPDVTKAGGVSEVRRIAWSAIDHGVRLIPHGWNTAVGLATDLQLAAAFETTDLVEYRPGSPYIDELASWQLEDGLLAIPDGPGLGLALHREVLERYGDPAVIKALPWGSVPTQ
jgi:L-alanine-DL-glutamate epimerase-like enolase superfamily enzyme